MTRVQHLLFIVCLLLKSCFTGDRSLESMFNYGVAVDTEVFVEGGLTLDNPIRIFGEMSEHIIVS